MSKRWVPAGILLATILAIQILTMPSQMYPGDNYAMRMIAKHLVAWGEFGIPYSYRQKLQENGLLERKGQYFIENDEHQKFYSFWGEGNTLVYLISEFLRNPSDSTDETDQVIYSNGLHIALTIVACLYLILLCQGLGCSFFMTSVFVFSALYGSYLWNYSRAQSYEMIHFALFSAYLFHFNRFLQGNAARHLLVSAAVLGLLIHSKLFYAVIGLPSVWLIWTRGRLFDRQSRLLLYVGILSVAVLAHYLISYYKLGFLTPTGIPPAPDSYVGLWSLSHIPNRIREYLVGVKASWFIHVPMLLPALYLWPRFWRNHRDLAFLILSTLFLSVIPLLCFSTHGEWCLGPRYLSFILPILLIPIAFEKSRAWAALAIVVSLVYALAQWQFNSRPYFLRHRLVQLVSESNLPQGKDSDAQKYLLGSTDLRLALDFNRFVAGNDDFEPIKPIIAAMPPEQRANGIQYFRRMTDQFLYCNYYFTFLCPPSAGKN